MNLAKELPIVLDGESKDCILKNCIRNHYKHIRKWAKRTSTNCFRIYDWQIPSYALAIDFYDGKFLVQYFSKKGTEPIIPEEIRQRVLLVLQDLFQVKTEDIFWRVRNKREKLEQYEKVDSQKNFFVVQEGEALFYVNLTDYLDSGLFLDHRETRLYVKNQAAGKRVLNLFAYTASFGVQAAIGGAVSSKNVDMSNTYCDWAKENLKLNRLDLFKHQVVRADCLKYVQEMIYNNEQYDLIIIDPPTISRSKKMDQFFDIQIDYVELINRALELLSKEGMIIFSTNSRQFRFDAELFPTVSIQDISKKTIPIDFHDSKIHFCWKICK